MDIELTKIQERIKKISGQLEGINRMIDDGRACQDIVQQIIAIRSALASLGIEVVLNENLICKNSPKQQSSKHLQEILKSMFKLS